MTTKEEQEWAAKAVERLNSGEASMNEIRAEAGLKPIPGGDEKHITAIT